jgi:ubiquinone/menaquinone biosynthesis C-methylase UbiE
MSAPAVQAVAEALPFRDRSFDASMAIFTIHHWADQTGGLAELQRVARRRIVILTSDPQIEQFFWLNEFYFPALTRLDRDRFMA